MPARSLPDITQAILHQGRTNVNDNDWALALGIGAIATIAVAAITAPLWLPRLFGEAPNALRNRRQSARRRSPSFVFASQSFHCHKMVKTNPQVSAVGTLRNHRAPPPRGEMSTDLAVGIQNTLFPPARIEQGETTPIPGGQPHLLPAQEEA